MNTTKKIFISIMWIILFLLVAKAGIHLALWWKTGNFNPTPTETSTSTPATVATSTRVTMKLYEKTTVAGTTFEPWAVLEDSRCPQGVQCVWAGRVQVGLRISGTSTDTGIILEPGMSTTTNALTITLKEVQPDQKKGVKIQDNEYQFLFLIENRSVVQ